MSMPRILILSALIALGPVAKAGAEPLNFASGDRRVAMVELFTSEGCNSCPPADRWIGELKRHPALWRRFVPLAFHVDYWDYIGWKDRFAKPEYGQRQKHYAAIGNARFVYTPGVFHNGTEWNGWRTGDAVYGATDTVGNLSLSVDGDTVRLRFDAAAKQDADLVAHIAILGMGLETNVRAGENAGVTLGHEFVVLGLRSVPLQSGDAAFTAKTLLPAAAIDAPEKAVVSWVSVAGRQSPLQAVGGFLPRVDGSM